MGTNNKKDPNLKGFSEDPTFFNSTSAFAYFKVMGTILLEYGYNPNLYYLSLLK